MISHKIAKHALGVTKSSRSEFLINLERSILNVQPSTFNLPPSTFNLHFTFVSQASDWNKLFILELMMRKQTLKYFIALIFLVIFSGGLSVSVMPGLTGEKSWSSLQKQETENNDSAPGENAKGIEIKEFEAEIVSTNLSSLHPELLLSHNDADDFSFVRTFYLLVPTPPPDVA